MLADYEREVATTLVEALCEYGLTDHLAQYGEHGTENWFCDNNLRDANFWASSGATKVVLVIATCAAGSLRLDILKM